MQYIQTCGFYNENGLADWAKSNVADPWYTGNFDATWDDVLAGCTALLEELRYMK